MIWRKYWYVLLFKSFFQIPAQFFQMFIRGDCLKLFGIFWLMLLTTLTLLPNKYPATLPVGWAIVQMVFQRKSKMDLNRQKQKQKQKLKQKQKQSVQRIVKFVKSSQSSELISGYFLFFWKLLLHNIFYCRLGKVYRHHWDAQTGNLILSLTFSFTFQHWACNIAITPLHHHIIPINNIWSGYQEPLHYWLRPI